MNKAAHILFRLLFLGLAAALSAGGSGEKAPEKEEAALVRISGTVRLVGSDPFPELVISAPEGEWYVAAEDKSKLFDLQHRKVTVEGAETVKERRYANGYLAGERRTLANITVIKVE